MLDTNWLKLYEAAILEIQAVLFSIATPLNNHCFTLFHWALLHQTF